MNATRCRALVAAGIAGCLLTLSALAAAGPLSATRGSAATARDAELQEALDAVVAAGVPGAILLVREGERTTRLTSGYANLARKTPMRASDRVRVGSATKAFVATVVLQLVGERKLTLGDSVERWLPGLVPDGEKITLRQLLNHTSGLYDYVEEPGFVERQLDKPTRAWTPLQLVRIGTRHDPLFAPGARWSYSNTGYILLGLVVEKATRSSLASVLRKRIFTPLHLRGTSFDTTPRITGRYAHGYTRFGKPRLTDISLVSATVFGAAGAIVSTADDLARFFRALLDGDLLRPDLLAAMKTTVTVTPQQRYGLGLFATRAPCGLFWGHGGGLFGYETFADSRADGGRQIVLALNGDQSVLRQRAQEAVGRVQALAYCG